MTLWTFLLLSEVKQLQVIRFEGNICHSRKDSSFLYELYALHDFYVEVCSCSSFPDQQHLHYFNDKNEVNLFATKAGMDCIFT